MMNSQDHCNSPGLGGKSHVCTKCGWSYPNPHPSAKNRRAHKKVCGTIKGFEIFDSEKAKENLDLQEEHCLNTDEFKTPSPRVVKKADERIGDTSEEDVFTDAVCEFSRSDSLKEKDETATNYAEMSTANPGENSSSTGCVMKSSEVVQDSCEVSPVEVCESYDAPSEVEAASNNLQGGETSTEALIESSKEAQVHDGGNTKSNVRVETECKGMLPEESELKVASALGEKEDTSDSSWNDDVIYSDVEGPHGFDVVATSLTHPEEAGCIVNENVSVETSPVNANAAQDISASQSVPDDIPFVENVDSSLHGSRDPEEENHSVNPYHPETPNGEECETDTQAENLGIQPEGLSIGTEVPSSDKLLLEDKTEPQGQTALNAVNEFPSAENVMISKIDAEDIEKKSDEDESSFGAAPENLGTQRECFGNGTEVPSSDKVLVADKTEPQGQTNLVVVKDLADAENIMISKINPEDIEKKVEEDETSFNSAQETVESETLKVSLPAVDRIAVDSNADVSSADNKTGVVDLTGHESEHVPQNVVAEEENNLNSKLSFESSCATENYASPVSVVLEGDDATDQIQSSTEKSKDSALQLGAEACESNDEVCREINKGKLVEESSFIKETNTTDRPPSHLGSTSTASDDSVKTVTQKSLESGRTEFHRVVGGLGVIQANEIHGNVKAHNSYAEVPVTIESNDHRDFGRLQNLSEAHIRSLVSSPLVNRNNTSQSFESNLGSVPGLSVGVNQPEHTSHNQEITLEKTTSWSSAKEQHVPLKNLLSEARSPKPQQETKGNEIPRVSSILGQETSPEDGRWPEKREVSEEWNSPAKYPVDMKREERKVKGRPFWVPFVCCSSVK